MSGAFTITIDHTEIDSALTDFPLMVNLSSSSGTGSLDSTAIFDELGSSSLKIKAMSGATECYIEIETWDSTTEKAVLWVKIPSISSTVDTEIVLSYDSTWSDNSSYVGVTGSTPGKAVWDSNFVAVYHMAQDPSGAVSVFWIQLQMQITGHLLGLC